MVLCRHPLDHTVLIQVIQRTISGYGTETETRGSIVAATKTSDAQEICSAITTEGPQAHVKIVTVSPGVAIIVDSLRRERQAAKAVVSRPRLARRVLPASTR
jgi:hypothetical protein